MPWQRSALCKVVNDWTLNDGWKVGCPISDNFFLFSSQIHLYYYIHYNITREDFLWFYASIVYSGNNLRSVEYEAVWKYTHIGQSWKNITKTMTVYKLRGFNLSSLPFKKDTGALLNSLRCVRNAFDERSDLLVCIFEMPSQSLNWKKILAPKHIRPQNLLQMLNNIAYCTLTSS